VADLFGGIIFGCFFLFLFFVLFCGNQYININLQIIKLSLFICCYLLALESCWT